MNEQHDRDSSDDGDAQPVQRPLESTRGSGDVLGGYRSAGDERHHRVEQDPGQSLPGGQPRDFGRGSDPMDHKPGYGNWGGPDEGATSEGRHGTSERPMANAGNPPGDRAAEGVHDGRDWGPPPGHYGGSQGGGGEATGEGGGPQQHDPDYHQWREQQLREMDRDYQAWRGERQQTFSSEFETWRQNRQRARAGESVPPAARADGEAPKRS